MSMEEIELSLMSYVAPDQLAGLVRAFEAQHRVHVRLQSWDWETSWAEIMKVALYGHGPLVSEVGSTWVASLAAMNVLRPFTALEVSGMGKASAFLPAAWQSGLLPGDPNPAAIPWLSETRAIYYRRDLFQQAGLADITQFESNAHLEDTLAQLRGHGLPAWTMPTRATLNTFHNLTSWVWGAGGDFVDAARRLVTFAEPAARAGMAAYFGLHRFMSPEARHLSVEESEARFMQGQAAVTISGPWLYLSPELSHAAGGREHRRGPAAGRALGGRLAPGGVEARRATAGAPGRGTGALAHQPCAADRLQHAHRHAARAARGP